MKVQLISDIFKEGKKIYEVLKIESDKIYLKSPKNHWKWVKKSLIKNYIKE